MHANPYMKGRSVAWSYAVQSTYMSICYFVATFVSDYMETTTGIRLPVYLRPYLDVSEAKSTMYKHVCTKNNIV
jgi:hypothetical protein